MQYSSFLCQTASPTMGVLLLNLGTPDAWDYLSVGSYLSAFLNDPRVVDLPSWIRWPLVNLFIIPSRIKRASEAYRSIWQETGSPLLWNSERLKKALSEKLGSPYQVALGMRYGNPSISNALDQLNTCRQLFILPLFPQYTSAVTGSALEQVLSLLSKWSTIPNLFVQQSFYNAPWFIHAYAQQIKKAMKGKKVDLFLFSYHGLPERQLNQHCFTVCGQQGSCSVTQIKSQCYRAQCYLTSKALMSACHIAESEGVTAFQSRLGKASWIKPYVDQLFPAFIERGVRSIAVICPSFVSDCLETLEEMGLRMKERWRSLGGGDFILIPSLNDEEVWVEALAGHIDAVHSRMAINF